MIRVQFDVVVKDTEPVYYRAYLPDSSIWRWGLALDTSLRWISRPVVSLFRHKLHRWLREIDWSNRMDCCGFEIRISRRSEENIPIDICKLCETLTTHPNLDYLRDKVDTRANRVICVVTNAEAELFRPRGTPMSCGYALPDLQVAIVVSDRPFTVLVDPQSYYSEIVSTMLHETAHLIISPWSQWATTRQGKYLEEMACSYIEDVDNSRLLGCVAAYVSGTLPLPSHILQLEQKLEFKLASSVIVSLIVERMGMERFCNAYLLRLRYPCLAPLFECFTEIGIESPHDLDAAVANYLRENMDKFEPDRIAQLSQYYSMKYAYELGDLPTALSCSSALRDSRYDVEASLYRASTLIKLRRYEEALSCIEATLECVSHPVPQSYLAIFGATVKRLLGCSKDYPSLILEYSRLYPISHLRMFNKQFKLLERSAREWEKSRHDILDFFGIVHFLSDDHVPRMVPNEPRM
ncbi:MAG: hypothetical protein KatS3mg054_1240 [Chloroflexus sp.]|nr:MAG: hypothetical protein KatS3mg054_1240 [Chloroflexus sp.]